MGNLIQVRLKNKDLIGRMGLNPLVPYDWAMQRISEGLAEIYQKPRSVKPMAHSQQVAAQEPVGKSSLRAYPEIAWIQDNNIEGGAELSGKQVIRIGESLGFDIHVVTPQNFNFAIIRKAKLLIINNIWTFNPTQMIEIKRAIFEFQVPYVRYEHDMRELYDSRLSFSRGLFKHSKLNVFISPLHIQEYQKKIFDMAPSVVYPLAIDVDKFKPNPSIKRNMKKAVHASGNLHNKGAVNLLSMVKQRRDMQFIIFTGDNKIINQMFAGQKNVRLRQRISNEEMADVYTGAGYLVHVPTGIWAGERVVLEAALCGCKLMINDNVGHKSWNWDFENVEVLRVKLRAAPYDFWRKIGEVMQ